MLEIVNDAGVVSLVVDGAEQSRVDTNDPGRLEFEYMQHMDAVVRCAFPEPQPLKVCHVGGGICALPWAWETRRPGSRQQVYEVSAQIAEQARAVLPLPRKPLLRIRTADGRAALEQSQAMFQVLVRDAFDGVTVPPHLQTLEWAQVTRSHTSGVYLANAAHGRGVDARPDVAATLECFPRVALIADAKVLRGARWGNIVVASWAEPNLVDLDRLQRELRRLSLPISSITGSDITKWLGGARPLRDPHPPSANQSVHPS